MDVPGPRIHRVPDVQPGPEGRGSCAPRRSLPAVDGRGEGGPLLRRNREKQRSTGRGCLESEPDVPRGLGLLNWLVAS